MRDHLIMPYLVGRDFAQAIEARDGVDTISKGSHDRFIIDAAKFNAGVEKKKAGG